jgi:hypothetical protein
MFRTAAGKIVLVSMLAGCSALAQNNEFGLFTGCVSRPLFQNCGWTTQLNYAWQVLDTRSGALYLEFPLFLNTSINNTAMNSAPAVNLSQNNIFFIPGVRYRLAIRPRVALYGMLGFGIGSSSEVRPDNPTSRTASGVFNFGGGADFRLTRSLSVRGEVRDFVSRPRFGGVTGRTITIYQLGLGFHF